MKRIARKPPKPDREEVQEILRQINSLTKPNAHLSMPVKWRRIMVYMLTDRLSPQSRT